MSSSVMATNVSSSRSARSTRGYLWLLGAILLFLLQTVPYLSYRFVTDESWYAGPAYTIAHDDGVRDPGIGPNDQQNHFDGRPPGTFFAMAASFRLFGVNAATARLNSVLAGVAIVALTFFLTRDALGELGAALAALLIATDNLIVLVSRSARPEALVVMTILAALLAMKRYADTRLLPWAALAGVLLAVGASFHITLLGYVISVVLLAIAIDWPAGAFPLRGAFAFTFGWLLGLCPTIFWLIGSPAHRAGFKEEFVDRAKSSPLAIRIGHELYRYSDLSGLHMLPGHLLQSMPVRLPIPLFFLFASWLLWRYRRTWFYTELLCLIPTVLWLAYTANKSSRYLSLLAPIFAITMAAATADAYHHRRRWKPLAAICGVIVVVQLAANLVLLHAATRANYTQVEANLRRLIPADQTAYGTITFWLGLHDGRYIAYERTTPIQAVRDFGARYFITGDPMQTNGSQWDQPYYDNLNATMAQIIAHSHRVGTVPSRYYGNLEVYHLDDPAAVLAPGR